MGPHGRRERSETPLRDYVPEPRHPPAYYAQPGQSTRAYPSGNTASYHPSNPAPIQPAQQPSSGRYRPHEYAPEPQDLHYNQAAYPQQTQEPRYDSRGLPQQPHRSYDDRYAYQRQYQTPYHTSSTAERAPYEQALPNYGYGAYASAIPGQPSGRYQQESGDVPRHPYAKASKNDAWDAAVRQVLEEESAVQHPSSLRGNTESGPRSRRSSRERGRQKETRTKRSGRDAFTEEAVGEPARTTKRPKGRHDSSDIVNVTQALDQVSLTAPAYAQQGLQQGREEYDSMRGTAKSKEKSIKGHDIQRQSLPRRGGTEESSRYAGVAPRGKRKDPAEVQKEKEDPAARAERLANLRLKRAEEPPTEREARLAVDRLKRAEKEKNEDPAKWTEKMALQRLKRAEESPTQREERLAGYKRRGAEKKAEKAKSEPHLPPLSHEERMEIALAKEAERKERARIQRQQPEAKEKDKARKRKYNEKKKKK